MTTDELIVLFREKLREGEQKKKYQGKFTPEDERRAVQTFRLALENTQLSDALLLEQLTGDPPHP